jgi:hypothetical protein
MQLSAPPESWHSFLKELDAQLGETVELHCIGGFVITVLYGLERPTSDVDFVSAVPTSALDKLMSVAGEGSLLHKKYGLYLDRVAIFSLPDTYTDRLVEIFAGTYRNLRLMTLEPYDLALSKLERNWQVDRDDIKELALKVPLEVQKLRQRYEQEMRPYLATQEREDLTLKLWIEMIDEVQKSAPSRSAPLP